MQNPKRVMLVEDEAVTAMDLKSNLIQLGYQVPAVIASGEEAVRQAAELLPDLILMDITLAGPMTGIQAAELINEAHHIPIIYLTAHTDGETLDRAKFTEPFGYLPKPCGLNTLVTTIEMAFYKGEADAARRRSEEELKQVMQEQAIILNNLGRAVLFLKNRKIVWANPFFSKTFGYLPDETQGMDTEALYPDRQSYLEIGQAGYAALARGEVYTFQLQMRKKDGTVIWCDITGQAVNPADLGQGSIWLMEDITERRRLEDSLRQSEEKFRTVADFTHDWEFWISPEERIVYCSPSCHKITGYPATAFEQDPSLLRQLVYPEDLERFDRHRHQCSTGTQGCSDFEFRITRADGEVRWIAHVCQPVFDPRGTYNGSRGSNRDVTERKRLQTEAAKARNLESLGILAGGIAHDFNNLFQGLLGNISLAKMSLAESSEAYQFLNSAEQVYGAAAKLTGQLIAFSSGGISMRTDMAPAPFLRDAVSAELGGSNLTVEFDLASNLDRINADPIQLRQVIKHMATNAVEAMPSGGRVRVSALNVALGPDSSASTTLDPGSYLKISIADQGCGIGPDDLPRIFDPYFSTKQRGAQKGMGLGLSLCSTIVQKHGGAITVESEQGRGTTFHIFLPALAIDKSKAAVSKESGGHGPRILIMDDDPGVVLVASKFLRSSGYRVDSARHGEAAISAYQEAHEAGDPYAVVILDLTIPSGLGGRETIAILKKFDPQVKAIISSGYVNDPAMTDFAAHGFVAAFEKPYQLQKLLDLLTRLLAAPKQ